LLDITADKVSHQYIRLIGTSYGLERNKVGEAVGILLRIKTIERAVSVDVGRL